MEISFNKNLKRLRLERNLKANELAKMLNVAPTTVSTWERGKSFPDVLKLVELCKLLHVSLDEIIFGHENDIFQDLTDLQKFIVKETVKQFRKKPQ